MKSMLTRNTAMKTSALPNAPDAHRRFGEAHPVLEIADR